MENQVISTLNNNHWAEHPDVPVPSSLLDVEEGAVSTELTKLKVKLSAREYPHGHEVHFEAHLGDILKDIFEKAAHALEKPLLPPMPQSPLDYFRLRKHDGQWSDPVTDFDVPLWVALAEGFSRHTAIEYRLVVRINTKWGVPTSANITPRELLTEFGFAPQEFSLYRPDSVQPLPPDAPIEIQRGECFEAQKDGKYGGAVAPPAPLRGTQQIEDDVAALKASGVDVELHVVNGQKYAEIRGVAIPAPPWSANSANVLIAIPATYPIGALDALYLEQGVSQNGSVPRAQSTVSLRNRNWTLISWHYGSARPWNPQADDLGTHVEHCRGYFLARGVVAQ